MSWASNPSGLCRCGCGQPTTRSPVSHAARGLKRGEPVDWLHGHTPVNRQIRRLEWERQDCGYSTPCWVWQMHIGRAGYGVSSEGGKTALAHRVVWEIFRGPVVEGLTLDHLCRNRACVNPEHLEPVTQAENNRRGINTRLTEEDVAAIRESGEKAAVLAARYGVSAGHVVNVRCGVKWREGKAA